MKAHEVVSLPRHCRASTVSGCSSAARASNTAPNAARRSSHTATRMSEPIRRAERQSGDVRFSGGFLIAQVRIPVELEFGVPVLAKTAAHAGAVKDLHAALFGGEAEIAGGRRQAPRQVGIHVLPQHPELDERLPTPERITRDE